MLQRPRLKTFLTVFPISDTAWGLRGGPEEVWRLTIENNDGMKAFCALLPYLDGQRSWEEIVRELVRDDAGVARLEKMLGTLQRAGLIEDVDAHGLTPEDVSTFSQQMSFFSRFAFDGGARHQAMLKGAVVGVCGTGDLARSICERLAATGVGSILWFRYGDGAERTVHPADETLLAGRVTVLPTTAATLWEDHPSPVPALFLVAEQEHNPTALEAMDRLAKRHQTPWILVRSTDVHEGSVGPLFIPGETASYISLEARLRTNMGHYAEYQAFDRHLRTEQRSSKSAGGLRASFDCLASIAVVEAVKVLTGVLPLTLAGKLLTVNIVSWETELHEVLRMPRLEIDQDAEQVYPWKEIPYAAEGRRG